MKRPVLRELLPIVLLVGFGLFLFAPFLFFGKAFFGEEQIGFYYAISDYVRQSLVAGTPLLWQSGYFGGVSASLDQFVGAWFPLNLFLFSHLDTFTAHHLSITIGTIAGLLLAYWFGRAEGWRRSSATILALAYFSATTYTWIQIGTIAAYSFAMLPGLMVALHYARDPRRRWIAILGGGAVFGVGLLAGFMQAVFYAYVVAGSYALFLDWNGYVRGIRWWRAVPASLSYAGITVLGLALGFRQFFPSAHLIDETIRTSSYAIQNAYQPLPTELIAFFMPPYLAIPFIGGGVSSGFYVGPFGLLLAALALVYFRTRTVVVFAALYAVVLAFAFHLPLFGWLNEHIPPFSHMGGNFRWMLGAAFPLAYLAAAGAEGFLRHPERMSGKAYSVLLWVSGGVAAALMVGGFVFSFVARTVAASPEWVSRIVAWYGTTKTLVYPPEHYHAVLEQGIRQVADTFSLTNPRFLFGALCWVLVFGFLLLLRHSREVRRFTAEGMVALTLLAVGGSAALHWTDAVPQAIYAQEPALVTLLKERESNAHEYRIFGYLLGDGFFHILSSKRTLTTVESTQLQHEILTNNANLYFGIDRMDGMEPYRTLRGNRLIHTVLGFDNAAYVFDDSSGSLEVSPLDKLYNRDVQKVATLPEKLSDLEKRIPLLSMMNVKYLYTPYELPSSSLRRVSSLPLSIATSTFVHVYENPGVMPRVYFATEAKFVTEENNEALRAVVGEKDFSKRTWIECGDCTEERISKGVVRTLSYAPGDVTVETRSATGGWLVFSESYVPGWEARIDGMEAPLYPANYIFQTVYIPAGTHVVSFVYRDVTVVELESLFR